MPEYLNKPGLKRLYRNFKNTFQTIEQVEEAIISAKPESMTDYEILQTFLGNNEIWIDSENWESMSVKLNNPWELIELEQNQHGFYVFDISDLGEVTTFVIQTSNGSKTTLELATTKAEIEELSGKIIQVAENSSNIEILAQKVLKNFLNKI